MIRLIQIHKQFGKKKLFEGADLHIKPGEHTGIVGPNGSGKTTLLKIIRGIEPADHGEVIVAKNKTIGYLEQDITETPAETVLEEVMRGFPEIAQTEGKIIELEQQLEARPADESLLKKYGRLRDEFERLDGYRFESKARAILTGVGFAPGQHKLPVRTFSGGWMMRIALARLLMQRPDILLMDEPTNHLDIQVREILQQALADYSGTIIFISHDRKMINAIASMVIEIQHGLLREFVGDYDYYLWKTERENNGDSKAKSITDSTTDSIDSGEAHSKKEERRQRAFLRQERRRRLKPLQDALALTETRFAELEAQKAALTEALCMPETIADKRAFPEKSKELKRISQDLEKEYETWSELTEQLESEAAEIEMEFNS